MKIDKEMHNFRLGLEGSGAIRARRVILSTGGASYKATGSTGDGFDIARRLGHAVVLLRGGLVPLKTKERWVKDLQGLTLENIRLTFVCGKEKIASEIGELLFTHFGVSGPLILDLSSEIVKLISEKKEVHLFIDLKPGLTDKQIDDRMLREIKIRGGMTIKTMFKELLPIKLATVAIGLLGVDSGKKINQLTQIERRSIVNLLKALKLTISGCLPLEEAMVTCGGISTKEIDPRTMQSRLVPGLYFAGEIIDATAPSGGFNLQQAFSTGYLAGETAAKCTD